MVFADSVEARVYISEAGNFPKHGLHAFCTLFTKVTQIGNKILSCRYLINICWIVRNIMNVKTNKTESKEELNLVKIKLK